MARPKVFISLPMRGRSEEDIQRRIKKIYAPYAEEYDCVHGLDNPEPEESEASPTWNIGHDILKLGKCDLVVFASDWATADGCRVERMICSMYGIPYTSERAST